MKLIVTPKELQLEFKRLIHQYKNFYWATAWAGIPTNLFDNLISHQNKIKKIIVGIHFHQTHPDFIESFLGNDRLKFIKQPEGTFHPKVYLFHNSENQWELLIGSANFTGEAFSRNTEATALIKSGDTNSSSVLQTALDFIESNWGAAKKFTKPELAGYRIAWKNHSHKINSLSGRYGGTKKKSKPIHEVPVINMSWKEFKSKVSGESLHGPEKRLEVLKISKQLFEKAEHFGELAEDERKFIAGIPNKLTNREDIDWGYFGSMTGAGIFKNKIKSNDAIISRALDQIPLKGQITRIHYDNYVRYFQKSLSGTYIGTATRLLAMKRPDTFVCLDSKNRSRLCRDFGIQQSKMTYERYWTDIIERIFDSDWWLNPDPKNEQEELISGSRAAFLDALYYKE